MSGSAETAVPPRPLGIDAQPSDLARIDRALVGLRHLWSTPPRIEDPALGSIDMSTIWIVDALIHAEGSGEWVGGDANRDDANRGDRAEPGTGGQPQLTIGALAQALDVAHSTASRLVDRAQASGAVVRGRSSTDARTVSVQVTGPGRELARTARAFRAAHLLRATAGWTESERATFADLLSRFAASVGDIDPA